MSQSQSIMGNTMSAKDSTEPATTSPTTPPAITQNSTNRPANSLPQNGLSILNDPPKFLSGPQFLHDLIQWTSDPSAVALEFDDGVRRHQYSYESLHKQVLHLASTILKILPQTQGSAQQVIPILLPQSPALYIAEYGILQAGAAFCPLVMGSPQERLKFVVNDVQASLVITTSEFKDILSWEGGPELLIISEFPEAPVGDVEHVRGEVKPAELAYVMYTSGSSGTPKGVAVSHLAAAQSLLAHDRHIPAFERFLQFAAPSFDVSVFEIFFPLFRAKTLVACNRSRLLNDLCGVINALEVDACELTPTVAGALVQKREFVPGLRTMLTIGEMLTRPVVEEFGGSEEKRSILYGMYGPTEAAIHCTVHEAMSSSINAGNIGIPFDTVTTYIAAAQSNDPENYNDVEILPVGEWGELVLAGPQVANGYLNRPDQNAQAFITYKNSKAYRTGDKARMLPDGTMEMAGRMSSGQVKLRGQRVELGEIEQAIYKNPAVKVAFVTVLNGILVSFIQGDITVEEVKETCRKWLPEFMVPTQVAILETFLYLPSGKIDRKRLEKEFSVRMMEEEEDVEPLTDQEQSVREALKEILGVSLGRTSGLPAAGLDSLLAIRVAGKLRGSGYQLTPVEILKAETLEALTKMCINSTSKAPTLVADSTPDYEDIVSDVKEILGGEFNYSLVETIIPCTPVQIAMLSETTINSKAYRNWVVVNLPTKNLSSESTRSIFQQLARRNTILRTQFVESDIAGGFAQLIMKDLSDSCFQNVSEFDSDMFPKSTENLLDPLSIQVVEASSYVSLGISIHHALYDAWSLELMLDDLDQLLVQWQQEQNASEKLPSRPSYSDLVAAYHNGTLAVNSQDSKNYWEAHLASFDPMSIPNFHSKSGTLPGLETFQLQTALSTTEVESVARSLGVAPQAIFQAAYAVVLNSYVGNFDVCFGTVFSGRTLPIAGIEDMMGPCLSTLPVRVEISRTDSVKSLIQQLNAINRRHLEYSTLPLRDIKKSAGIDPGTALFDSILVWQQTLHSQDLKRENAVLFDSKDFLEFSLTLEITPDVKNIQIKANYQRALFPLRQIELLLGQIESLTKALLEGIDGSVLDAQLAMNEEVLSIENPTPDMQLCSNSLAADVEGFALSHPDNIAIDFATSLYGTDQGIHSVSYKELNESANRVAHHLIAGNVIPNDPVCIFMEKSAQLYASILATVKVGAGYVPVTPETPFERLQYIVKEANVKVLISTISLRSVLQALTAVEVVYLEDLDVAALPANNPAVESHPDNLAYCVYTSGSTGTPKGVQVTQGNMIANLDFLQTIYPRYNPSRLLQSCSQAFDVSVFEIFFAWRIGGTLCSATKDTLFRDIEHAIRVLQISHLSLTPTVAALINPDNVPTVKFLVTAGEAVTQKVFNLWAGRGLFQGYGPSETTNICTVLPNVAKDNYINIIGPTFKNTSAFVLAPDEFLPLPHGAEGEFCFGGVQVFRGYLNQVQNEGRIVVHEKFGRIYRSGDFGRIMPDGSLAFTGRKDEQVKIRGQRVELGEINSVMLKLASIKDCVTLVVDSKTTSAKQLICFFVATKLTMEGETLEDIIEECYVALKAALPIYMIPSALIPVDKLPSTTQGKIDKRLLVRHYQSLSIEFLNSTSNKQPSEENHTWSPLQSTIATAVSQIAGLTLVDVGPHTNFFSVGIDSISAIALSRKLREQGIRIEISDILKNPEVVRLSARIIELEKHSQDSAVFNEGFKFGDEFVASMKEKFEKQGLGVDKILPCTPLQEAMLSASEGQGSYANRVVLDIHGDVQKLRKCFEVLIQRHEILRTAFVQVDDKNFAYAQVVLNDFSPLHEISHAESRPPYSLNFVEKGDKVLLELSMHHALYDGVAMSLIYSEVEKLYAGKDLPSPVSFQPFLEYMNSRDLNAADTFWHGMLAGFTPASFPNANPAAGSIKTSISSSLPLSSIESLVKKNSTSLLSVCQASWAALLSTYTSKSDICFGNIVSGRTVPVSGTDSLIAPTFNTLPIRLSSLNDITHLETFRKLQDINVESLVYQLTPLRRIQAHAGGRLFDTLFLMQQEAENLDSNLWELKEDDGEMDLPIVIEVIPEVKTGVLRVWLHVRGLSEVQAQTILKTFDAFLKKSLEKPSGRLLDLSGIDKTLTGAIPKPVKETKSNTTEDGKEGSVPSSEVEIKIRDAYAAFTNANIDMIKRNTSIYRLGIDSISAVQVASRLRRDGYILLASDVLQHPNISELSAFIVNSSESLVEATSFDFANFESKHRDEVLQKVEGDVRAIRPCTPVQCGMIAQSIHSNGKEYFNSLSMDLPSDMDISRLRNAWEIVAKTHEMLRTGFVSVNDALFPFAMVTYSPESFKLPWITSSVEILDVSKYLQSTPWSLQHLETTEKSVVKFAAHHALYDAHSINLVLSDVARIYDNQAPTSSSSIDSLLGAILLSSKTSDEQEEFWKTDENKLVISKFPDLTPLRISGSLSYVEERVCAASLEFLEQSCREQSITMQAIGEAAWAKLLAAYSGEFSVSFGVTLSGRSIIPEADSITFPSIVTVPRRCDVVGTNAELISRTMGFNAATTKFQFTPLAHIQRWSGFPEGKVFDTLFAYQKSSSEEFEVPWTVINEEASVDYAVSIELQPSNQGLILRLTFRENLVPIEQARTILSQLEALMMDLLQNPQKSAASTPAGGNDILSITPANEPIIPCEVKLLHDFVTVQAQKTPDKIALEFATNLHVGEFTSRKWTYTQLERESSRVANMLLQKGVQPGGLVAICFDKCAEASISIVGIMKTGCAYVALDPNAPPDRLNYIVSDSGATLALSAGKPAETLKDNVQIELIAMDSLTVLQGISDSKPVLSRRIDPEDTSYCLYTSGTTGTPKGCSLTHSNAVQAMLAFQRLFSPHWDEDSKWLQFASFHFDVSVLEQFWSWSVGICVASAPRDLIFEDIPSAIQQLGITHIDLTPSLARLLTPEEVPSLCRGVFITGGEQLKQEILDTWGEKMCIYNGYGPTEATIGVTMYPRVPRNGKPANIGPQFDNVGSYVLTPDTFNPVMRGAIGELCVSGALVGKGYLNRPELTAEKFPFVESFGETIYRTGDLVRIVHDGTFIFLGRADDQVKLRGQRLELSEINEVAKKVEGVEEVVTLVLKHPKQIKEQLVMFFVTTRDGRKLKPEFMGGEAVRDRVTAVKDVCKGHLPGYMVPTHFLTLTTFPLNPNNKNDAKRLAQMYNELTIEDLQSLSRESENAKGFNDDEKKVVEVLAGAFGMDAESMTRDMNIFELGIDSISVIGLSRTLINAGYSNAKLAVVMGNPSIGSLVGKLLQEDQIDVRQRQAQLTASQNIAAFAHKHTGSALRELGVDRHSVESVAPATPMQEGMIYRFLNAPDALYFLSFEFALGDNVSLGKLRAAWEAVHRGVQILRTKFVITDDGYAQVALKDSPLPWEIVEKDSFDYSNIEKTSAIKEPYRVTIKKSAGMSNMVLRIFHGLYDGNSLPMILSHVVGHYQGNADIDFGPSFQSALQYGPMLSQDGAKEFWQKSIPTHRFSTMPCLAKQPSNIDVAVSAMITDIKNIEEFRQRLNTTYQAILQAAWASVIQKYLSTRLTFGMVSSGRSIDLENADRVIGPLFNTIPFFLDIKSGMTWKSLIKACHDFNVAALPFQHTPLKNIQKWCGSGNTSKDMFDTLFVFQREEDGQSASAPWKEVDGKQVADYPLAFEACLLENGNISMVIVAQGQTMDIEAASGLLEEMKTAMHMAVSQPDSVVEVNEPSSPTSSTSTDGFVFVDTPRPSPDDEISFVWTEQAKKIRNELAILTAMDIEAIGAYAPIFELGLDSIDIIKLSSRLKHQQVVIPVSAIIKAQTIAKIVDEIRNSTIVNEVVDNDAKLRDLEQKLLKHLETSNRLPSTFKKILPATPLQEAMVAEMLNSGYTRYFNHEVLKVDPSTDLNKLQSAWDAVIEQTDILRTTFINIEDAEIPVIFGQLVHHPSSDGWTYQELPETADLDAELYFAFERARKSAEHGGPLLQLSMLQYQKRYYLVLSISHALYDGSSIQMLHEDVRKAYEDSLSVRPDPEVVLQDILVSNEKDAVEFWKTTLLGAPSTSFPTRPSQENGLVHRFEHAMTTPMDKIQTFCRNSGISLQTLGQTCWALLLAKHVQRLDVTFGCVLSCRDTEESQEILFPLMNTVTIRAVLHGTILDLLRYMQDTGNAMRKYQHFPLRKAQALADADGRLFDTLFIHQGKSRTDGDSKSLYEAVDGSSAVEYPVCVEMEIVDETLVWRTACQDSTRNYVEAEDLLKEIDVLLTRMIDSPGMNIIDTNKDGISICGQSPVRDVHAFSSRNIETIVLDSDSPWSEIEVTLRQILSQVSGISEDEISRDQSIYHLGLDSISAIKVSSLLRVKGIRFTVNEILKLKTIRKLAQKASETVVPGFQEKDKVQNGTSSITGSFPVTAGQEYTIKRWSLSGGGLFCSTFDIQISGDVDQAKLEKVWQKCFDKLPILQTFFQLENGQIYQVNDPTYHGSLVVGSKSQVIVELSQSIEGSRFWGSHPVALILDNTGDVSTLHLWIHHALYDGASLPHIMSTINDLYIQDDSVIAAPASIDLFKNYAELLQSNVGDGEATREMFWTSSFKKQGQTFLHPERLRESSEQRTELFVSKAVSLDDNWLKSRAKTVGVSAQALLIAAFAQRVGMLCEQGVVTFGIYVANRQFDDGGDLIAVPTVNILPVQVEIANNLDCMAEAIAEHLDSLRDRHIAGSSLAEIYKLTGHRIQFVLNILQEFEDNTESQLKPKFSFKQGEKDGLAAFENVVPSKQRFENIFSDDDMVPYMNAIDIEIGERGGMLDIGVFAPNEMLDVDEAKAFIEGYKSSLETIR